VSHARAARHARAALVLVALAVALAVGALLGVAASPSGADAVQPVAPAVDEPAVPAAPALPTLPGYDAADPFVVALLGPDTDASPERVVELLLAADRVCEGFTAEVPVVDLADTVAEELSLTDEEARAFVNTAGTVRCYPAA
jgi:hypothetical protein